MFLWFEEELRFRGAQLAPGKSADPKSVSTKEKPRRSGRCVHTSVSGTSMISAS